LRRLISAVLDGDFGTIERLLDAASPKDPSRPLIESLALAVRALNGEANSQQALSLIRDQLKQPADELELIALLYRTAAELAVRARERPGAQSALRALLRFDQRKPSEKLRVAVRATEARVYGAEGDLPAAVEACSRGLELPIEPGSPLWVQLCYQRARWAVALSQFQLADRDLAAMEVRRDDCMRAGVIVDVFRADFCDACGRAPEGLAKLEAILPNRTDTEAVGDPCFALHVSLLIKSGQLDRAGRMLDEADRRRTLAPASTHVLRAQLRMAGSDFVAAADHARQAISALSGNAASAVPANASTTPVVGELANALLVLCWVELAHSRGRDARRVLTQLHADEAGSPYHVEWARLHVLEGNELAAAAHLRAALDERIPEYIEDRLRFANELPAVTFARLLRLAQRDSSGLPAGRIAAARPAQTPTLVGESPAIRAVRDQIARFAPLDTAILIVGETGTGKDVVARLIHATSPRAGQTFLPINCAAISDTLIESELFGHVKGAFTGASSEHTGLFEAAKGGTIFLDEIHTMSPRLQGAMLRVLENGEFRPVGGAQDRHTKARVLAATNEALEEAVAAGRFRADLYYRIARFHIRVPPLRERPDDILVLARHFLRGMYDEFEVVLSEDLMAALRRHAWPGNVRELKNEIERIALLAGEDRVLRADLFRSAAPHIGIAPSLPQAAAASAATASDPEALPTHGTLGRRDRLRALFDRYRRLTRAQIIELLGCSPNTATSDLRALETEGWIRRIHTSAHLRTSYFVRSSSTES
jgi:DNA-binding NtrC family response regulator/tetratricopeptide (TPR) repeat protein